MPINYKLYGKDFRERSRVIRALYPRCAYCGIANYAIRRDSGTKVILTVHHQDHNIQNNEWGNLVPLCQRCHLGIHHQLERKNTDAYKSYVAYVKYKWGDDPDKYDVQMDIFKEKGAKG